ncbi:MAG TPA: MFS transporter [Candidatus Limnocylindrales bacterium]|jgi:MFS family permease
MTTSPRLPANYWKLWASSAASNLADGVFWIAFPLLAVRLTDSPVLIAGVAVVGRLPWLVFVLFAGALADRLDRRRTMVLVAVLRTVISLAIAGAIITRTDSLAMLYLAAFVLGVGETLFDTAAQSIMPSIVDRGQLSKANGRLYAAELTMNQFVGPPLGGILAGVAMALAFVGSAAAFAVGAVALTLLVGQFWPATTPGRRPSVVADIREGLRYLVSHRLLRTLALMVGVMNLASSAAFAIFVLFAVAPGPMGLDEFGFGVLMTALAMGSLLGSLLVERVEKRLGRATLLSAAVLVSAVSTAIPGLTPNPWVVGAAFALAGFGSVMWNVVTVSLRQRIVPDALLGRVNASYRLLAWGSQPIGALLGGLIGQALGLPAVFLIAGAGTALLLFARSIVTDAAIGAAEAEGDAEVARLASAATDASDEDAVEPDPEVAAAG